MPRRKLGGFSLIELMITMALGLAIVAAVGTLSLNAARSYRAMNRSSEQIENGRYALKIIKDDLEHAGFFGTLNPSNAGLSLPTSVPDPCGTANNPPSPQTLYNSLLLPISSTCGLSLTSKVSSAGMLILLRANSATTALGVLNPRNTYIQTNPAEVIIGKGASFISNQGAATAFSLRNLDNTNADIRQLHVRIYYVRSYSQSGDGIPTLMRRAPTDTDSDARAIIEGIENLQLQYGLDGTLTTDCNSTPAVGDGAPDAYYAAGDITCWKDWSNIVSVKVYLLVRSLESDPSLFTDTKTYDLGNLSVTPGGNYQRRVFSQVVRLINVSARREK
jgi:type IV pilus assembly protein PilW